MTNHRYDESDDAPEGRDRYAPPDPDRVRAAWSDTKLAQVLYHDWEANSYDEKWSISFDQRCISYARDRFVAVAGAGGWPYGRALEVGCGTGFFSLNLKQAGVIDEVHVSDVSAGMIEATVENGRRLGYQVSGQVADLEKLPYPDDSFDLVIGHAVLHHIPNVQLALAEILRVLAPGGRFVICGEPTRYGDRVARRLGRATWWLATRATQLPVLRDSWARPQQELDESSEAAALEAVVDLHTFDPDELARTAREAGGIRVHTVTEELTASWFGWPVRTFEAAVPEDRLGWGWATFAYRTWQGLCRLDRALKPIVPAALYYNVSVTGVRA